MYVNQLEFMYVQYKFITVLTVESLAMCLFGLSLYITRRQKEGLTDLSRFSNALSILSNVQY